MSNGRMRHFLSPSSVPLLFTSTLLFHKASRSFSAITFVCSSVKCHASRLWIKIGSWIHSTLHSPDILPNHTRIRLYNPILCTAKPNTATLCFVYFRVSELPSQTNFVSNLESPTSNMRGFVGALGGSVEPRGTPVIASAIATRSLIAFCCAIHCFEIDQSAFKTLRLYAHVLLPSAIGNITGTRASYRFCYHDTFTSHFCYRDFWARVLLPSAIGNISHFCSHDYVHPSLLLSWLLSARSRLKQTLRTFASRNLTYEDAACRMVKARFWAVHFSIVTLPSTCKALQSKLRINLT